MKFNIKRSIASCLVLLIGVLSVASVNAAGTDHVKAIFMGDSIATGYGLEKIEDSYFYQVTLDRSYHALNYAINGHKSTDLLSLLKSNDPMREDISTADVIFISIGGNDLIGLFMGASTTQLMDILTNGGESVYVKTAIQMMRTNLDAIMSEIHGINSDCTVVFQTQYNPIYAHPQYKAFADKIDAFAPLFNNLFYSLAEKNRNVYVADVYTAFDNYYDTQKSYDVIQSDGIHPSEKGHALIRDVLLQKVSELETAGAIPTTPTLPERKYYLLGDCDGNKKVNILDATTIQKVLAGLGSFDEVGTLCADANLDNSVNVKDVTAIQKHLAGLLPNSEIGNLIAY